MEVKRQLEQPFPRQLHQVPGSVATIKVSNLAGTAHPMTFLSRVEDTWGSFLVLEQLRQSKAAEQEARLFSNPAPDMQKHGSTAQGKAASAGKQNLPAATSI